MISKFRIKNFRSIVDLTLDFSYGEGKAPNGYREMYSHPFLETPAPSKERLVPCMAIFGANASGKTNIVAALTMLRHLMSHSIDEAKYVQNMLHSELKTTLLEATFFTNEHKYLYKIEFAEGEILEETLDCDEECLYSIMNRAGMFFNITPSDYPTERIHSIFNAECVKDEKQKATFLSRIEQYFPSLNSQVSAAAAWCKGLHIVPLDRALALPDVVKDILKKLSPEDRAFILPELTKALKKLDVDIDGLSVEKSPWENTELLFSHYTRDDGETVTLDFRDESQGTNALLILLTFLLPVLKSVGGVFIIDEIDASLHPVLLREIVQMFKSRRHNTGNTQMIFTTHTTDILEDSILRPSEITLVRKTRKWGTLAKRLVEMKNEDGLDIRNVTNFRKQYLDGFYSGIPHPAI